MSKKVIKFLLDVNDEDQHVYVPDDFVIVSVGIQRDDCVALWGETRKLNIEHKKVNLTFRVFETGQDIPDYYSYVGTVVNDSPNFNLVSTNLVWHVYLLIENQLIDLEGPIAA